MSSTGSVKTDPLFKGLTRPAMLFGVSYTFAIMNFLLSTLTFIYTNDFKILLILAPMLHVVGLVATRQEPLFLEMVAMKLRKCNICPNRFYHGANSYDVQ